MFSSINQIQKYCQVSHSEAELLLSDARPIVLLNKINDFDKEICCGSDRIGAMLPCNPLQILLIDKTGPLVMTSANRGGEPIVIDDATALSFLEEKAVDFVITHEREILTPLEDSVCQIHQIRDREATQFIRRGRGFVPNPVDIGRTLKSDAIGLGGDLKAVFALGRKNYVYPSAPYGDLTDYRCTKARANEIGRMSEILGINPKISAMDKHPGYVSKSDVSGTTVEFYHHHAHILSVMAEHHLEGPVLGISFDGTGYGEDATIWGGECLLCNANIFERVGCLAPVRLMASDIASKDCRYSALGYLLDAQKKGLIAETFINEGYDAALVNVMSSDYGKIMSSSMGRLFDAVAQILGICDYNSYEGEAASKLENCAIEYEKQHEKKSNNLFAVELEGTDILKLDTASMIATLVKCKEEKMDINMLAYAFHQWVIKAAVTLVEEAAQDKAIPVAFSGGCFVNRLLYKGIYEEITDKGYKVFTNEQVPCTDGGLALGQLYGLSF